MAKAFTSADIRQLIKPHLKQPFVFLETASFNKENTTSFLFTDFSKIITFRPYDDINLFFEQIEEALKRGFWLCGYFSYEFGYFLEPALYHLREKTDFPLAWLGVCQRPQIINHLNYHPRSRDILADEHGYSLGNLTPNIKRKEYSAAIETIKKYLEEGLTYQVNFTFKVKFNFEGSLLDFYLNLRRRQLTSYLAFINTGSSFILSFSPELFFRKEKGRIISRPMKGTAKRGLYQEEDRKNKLWLKRSRKIKAENVMIVDLLRNDLGKISNRVMVPRLFEIEKYRTLYQMTSTIEGRSRENIDIKSVFSSLFPCGSVSGAPKIKTMQIIKELEKESRGVYSGGIGYISPYRDACFNVAIRTLVIEDNKGELGVGGGIVYDSLDDYEYEEALLKTKFAVEKQKDFSLIETVLWQRDRGYFLLNLHIKRLINSCKYFSIPLELKKLKEYLDTQAKELKKISFLSGREKFKIRIIMDSERGIRIEREFLQAIPAPVKVKVSSQRISPANVFLYHKTTVRDFYNEQLKKAQKEGFSEVIFFNIYGELTEGTFTNVFLLKEGKLYTPPLHCGLLGGVLRKHFLKEGRGEEKTLFLKDILKADKVYIGNSVRGLLEAKVYLADLRKKSIIEMHI